MRMVTRLIYHGTKPARCILDDGTYTLDSHVNVKNAVWYMRGDIPPRYPVPAIPVQTRIIDGVLYVRWSECGEEIVQSYGRN